MLRGIGIVRASTGKRHCVVDTVGFRAQGASSHDVGIRRLSVDGRDVPAPARPAARRGVRHRAGHERAGCRRRTGNASIPAAQRGAQRDRERPHAGAAGGGPAPRADAEGLELDWVEADAEHLPFEDESFDVVMSSIGAMFAPHHQDVADELVRVCRPGGTIGLLSWTPEGMIGALFRTMGPFAPPPPPGAQPPPLWGSEDHLRELFGDRVEFARSSARCWRSPPSSIPRDYGEHFKARYGPTIAVRANARKDRARGGVRRRARPLLRRVEPRHRGPRALREGVPARRRHSEVASRQVQPGLTAARLLRWTRSSTVLEPRH